MFNSTAPVSTISTKAAEKAGVRRDTASNEPAKPNSIPVSPVANECIAQVQSFTIGGEVIRDTRIKVENIGSMEEDMVLGADFFLSHCIYVANSQDRLYFTYNGGPVFAVGTATDREIAAAMRDDPALAKKVRRRRDAI